MLPNIGNLEQAKNFFKQQAMQKLKNELKKKLRNEVSKAILTNPYFWAAVGIILAIVLVFYLIAAMVSSTNNVANQTQITEKIVPPQIYISDMESAITDDFGERINPRTGLQEVHTGVDIGVPVGTPISSSFDGVVRTVSYPRSSDSESTKNAGIYVVVQSSDPDISMSSRYLHLSEAYVTPGQTVKKGEIIGLSGNTGQSTGPHLHFEMIPDGEEAIDPKPYVMLMSKLTDTASQEAFRAMNKINWSSMRPTGCTISCMPYYESNKMLYVSGVYMETAAPAFSPQGTVYIRGLYNGGSSSLGTIPYDNTAPAPPPQPDETVTVPTTNGSLTDSFMIQYAAAAQQEERRSGVPASITLAQAALESGHGASAICNNLFGIKADRGWSGPSCLASTHEEIGGVSIPVEARFRSYDSPAGSFADHSDFLLNNGIYRTALSKSNPYEFANELQMAGYATDSQYANKLKSIIRGQDLTALDMNHGIDPATSQPFNDVPFMGGGGSGSGSGDTITINFGVRQLYGTPAAEALTCGGFGGYYTCYSQLSDPDSGKPIINLVNWNRVVNLFQGRNVYAPNIAVKDIPDAITVTLSSASEDELYVSHVDYVKGRY